MQKAVRETAVSAADIKDNFIPVRKTDILDALVEHAAFADERERDYFRQICKLLAVSRQGL